APDVRNLLLREWMCQPGSSIAAHPDRRFAKQVCDSRRRIAPAAIDQPFISDRFVALDETPEESLHFRMGFDDRIEILGLAHHHFASDDCLDSILSGSVARQDAFP